MDNRCLFFYFKAALQSKFKFTVTQENWCCRIIMLFDRVNRNDYILFHTVMSFVSSVVKNNTEPAGLENKIYYRFCKNKRQQFTSQHDKDLKNAGVASRVAQLKLRLNPCRTSGERRGQLSVRFLSIEKIYQGEWNKS